MIFVLLCIDDVYLYKQVHDSRFLSYLGTTVDTSAAHSPTHHASNKV